MHLAGLPLEAAAADMNAAPHAQRGRQATADCLAALEVAAAEMLAKEDSGVARALADRLLFRRDLLRALSALRGKQADDLAAAAEALKEVAVRVEGLRANGDLANGEEEEEEEEEEEGKEENAIGFVRTLNNHLTPPSPPRQLKVREREVAGGIDRPIDCSVDWSVGRSVDRSVDRSIGRSVGRSIGRSVGRSVDRSIVRSVDRSVGRSVDRSIVRLLSRRSIA